MSGRGGGREGVSLRSKPISGPVREWQFDGRLPLLVVFLGCISNYCGRGFDGGLGVDYFLAF